MKVPLMVLVKDKSTTARFIHLIGEKGSMCVGCDPRREDVVEIKESVRWVGVRIGGKNAMFRHGEK